MLSTLISRLSYSPCSLFASIIRLQWSYRSMSSSLGLSGLILSSKLGPIRENVAPRNFWSAFASQANALLSDICVVRVKCKPDSVTTVTMRMLWSWTTSNFRNSYRLLGLWFKIRYRDTNVSGTFFRRQLRLYKRAFELLRDELTTARQDTRMRNAYAPEKILAFSLQRLVFTQRLLAPFFSIHCYCFVLFVFVFKRNPNQ